MVFRNYAMYCEHHILDFSLKEYSATCTIECHLDVTSNANSNYFLCLCCRTQTPYCYCWCSILSSCFTFPRSSSMKTNAINLKLYIMCSGLNSRYNMFMKTWPWPAVKKLEPLGISARHRAAYRSNCCNGNRHSDSGWVTQWATHRLLAFTGQFLLIRNCRIYLRYRYAFAAIKRATTTRRQTWWTIRPTWTLQT